MLPERPIAPSTLSVKDLPWQIDWDRDTCTLCGKCTASCPVNAIELGVFRKRLIEPPVGFAEPPPTLYRSYYGVRQRTDPAYACVGCAMARFDTLADAARSYGQRADELLAELDRAAREER